MRGISTKLVLLSFKINEVLLLMLLLYFLDIYSMDPQIPRILKIEVCVKRRYFEVCFQEMQQFVINRGSPGSTENLVVYCLSSFMCFSLKTLIM